MIKVISRCILILFLFSIVSSVQALKLPNEYGARDCKIIADDFKAAYGGVTIFIDTDMYPVGHWLNKININNNIYYIDYGHQRIFKNSDDVVTWYISETRFTDARLIDMELS